MKIAKILIRLLLLTSIVGGGVYIAKQKTSLRDSEVAQGFEEKKEDFQGTVKGVSDSISKQAQQLTTRGQEVGEHVGTVLENYVQPADQSSSSDNQGSSSNQSSENSSSSNSNTQSSPKPIYEETIDYGRYLYCQQVIKDYEINH